MSGYTLTVPEDVYDLAQQIADERSQPVDRVLIDYLRTLSPSPLPVLPEDEEAELAALRHLSDDALWMIAREQMPIDLQEQVQDLMDRNTLGTITPDALAELEGLIERGQRLMVRKSEAMALLVGRRSAGCG